MVNICNFIQILCVALNKQYIYFTFKTTISRKECGINIKTFPQSFKCMQYLSPINSYKITGNK